MDVALVQSSRRMLAAPDAPHDAPRPLLASRGARVVLGGLDAGAAASRAAADRLAGPRGAALAGPQGPLFVCDTNHHRLLAWRLAPMADGAPADLVFGQPDALGTGRNARREIGPATLNTPTGVAVGAGVLAVADAWNHRVLIWHGLPLSPKQQPDIVLGQNDFRSGLANRGRERPAPDTLNWPYGVAVRGSRVIVADTGNRRVLVWDSVPQINGAPADLVLGQGDFWSRDEAGGQLPLADRAAAGMYWPHAVALDGGMLFVADSGASRVMVWQHLPDTNGAPCDAVLGQASASAVRHNRGASDPTGGSLHLPHGIAAQAARLVVADTANSRLLGFDLGSLATGAAADGLAGQRGFHDKGENRWGEPGRDTLSWPCGVSLCGDTAVVADTGNNRVLLWDAA